jgi:hypothetical protein
VGSEGQVLPEGFDRKIVKSAELGIRAEAVRESAAQAQQIAQDDGSIYANLVLSIPSPEFEKALDELRGLGKEVTTDTSGGRT